MEEWRLRHIDRNIAVYKYKTKARLQIRSWFQAPYILPVSNLRVEGIMDTRTSASMQYNPANLAKASQDRAKPFPLAARDNLKANEGIEAVVSE